MAESQHQSIPTRPIAPRVKDHHRKPHVGPDIHAYRDHHAKTVGEFSDEWWAQVRPLSICPCSLHTDDRYDRRPPGILCTGIVLSRLFVLAASKLETSSGSPKVALMPHTTASTDGLIPNPIRFVTSVPFYFAIILAIGGRSALHRPRHRPVPTIPASRTAH